MTPELLSNQSSLQAAHSLNSTENKTPLGQAPGVNLLFVDSAVDNIDTLISQVEQGTQVIVLNSQTDGISQITDALSDYQNVSSLSVVSHGDSGLLQLGSSSISSASLSTYRDELQSWQSSLSTNADILFYGCNVAAGQKGANFLNQFGQLTGADIAASTDLTGSAALGGDWELEYARGEIETESPFSPKLVQSYDSVLAQYKFEGTSYRLHSKTKHGVNTVKNPSGSGDATRIELRYDDPWVSNKRRAEVIPSLGKLKWGSTYTYELSKFIPNSWKGDSRFEILMQWHQQPDRGERWGNPPMVLDASGNQIRLRTTIEQGSKKVKKTLWSAKLEKGSWIDYKFEINWSKNSNGYVKAWQNGKQIVNHKGQTANNDQEVPFMKYGIYKHNWESKSTERVLYFKNFDFSEGSSSGNGGNKSVRTQSIDTNVDTNNGSTTRGRSSAGSLKIEAESLQLSKYRVERNSSASGGKLIGLSGKGSKETGKAVYVHKGSKGTYNLDLKYYDEKDGTGQFQVKLNGKTLDRWKLNARTNSNSPNAKTSRTRTIGGLTLKAGDRLTITGTEDGGEHALLDALELTPTSKGGSANKNRGGNNDYGPNSYSGSKNDYSKTYQAEDAKLIGVNSRRGNNKVQGRRYVQFDRSNKDAIEWTIDVPKAGRYRLDWRYAQGDKVSKSPLKLVVNGKTDKSSPRFSGTGGWNNWELASDTVSLKKGRNTIRLRASGKTRASIDSLDVVAV